MNLKSRKCCVCDSNMVFVCKKGQAEVFRCPNCDFYIGVIDENEISNVFETDPAYFANLTENHEEHYKEYSNLIRKRLDKFYELYAVNAKYWLEIGPGNGCLAQFASGIGAEWLGIEYDNQRCELMKNKGFNVISADFQDCQPRLLMTPDVEKNGGFDFVYFSQVLEHVSSPREFIKNVYDSLRPGGVFYFDVPNGGGLIAYISKYFVRSGKFLEIKPPHHMASYNKNSLRVLLNTQKFTNVSISAFDNLHEVFGLPHARLSSKFKMRLVWIVTRIFGMGGNLVAFGRKPF